MQGQNETTGGHEKVITLELEGEIGLPEMEEILDVLGELAAMGVEGVVLDFDGVRHFHYRAVKPLLDFAKLLREAGGDVKLCSLSTYLKAIFRSVGAQEAFEFFADASEARLAFQSLNAVFC